MSGQKSAWSDTYSIAELLDMIRSHRHALQPGQLGESVDKISATISTLKSQRDELLELARVAVSEHPYGQRQRIVMDQLRAAIANSEKAS